MQNIETKIEDQREPSIFNPELYKLINTAASRFARGSFSEVFTLDPDQLLSVLNLSEEDLKNPIIKEKFNALLSLVIKKASEDDYVQPAFWGKEPGHYSKKRMHATFGPVGMPISPSEEKTEKDILESTLSLLYLGNGYEKGIDVLRLIKEIKNDALTLADLKTDDLLTTYQGKKTSIFEFCRQNKWIKKTIIELINKGELSQDDFPENEIHSAKAVNAVQKAIQKDPLTEEMSHSLKKFFESQMVVGLQPILLKITERLRGLRRFHPHCGWPKAEEIIKYAFEKHGNIKLIPSETNYYGLDSKCSEDKYKKITAQNTQVVAVLTDRLIANLSPEITKKFGREQIFNLIEKVLQYYHDYPHYEVIKSVSLFSITMMRTLYRILYHSIGNKLKLPYQEKKNKNIEPVVKNLTDEKNFETIFQGVSRILNQYEKEKGVISGKDDSNPPKPKCAIPSRSNGHDFSAKADKIQYQRLPTVSYISQERANKVEEGEKLIDTFSLADLRNKKNWHYFTEFPDLAEKLLIFAVLVYRQFSDTGYIPDLRPPKNAVIKTLLYGIYGYETENVIITLKENAQEEKFADIKLIDNKDQMKKKIVNDPKKEKIIPDDLEEPPGLAKTAFGVAKMIGEVALLIFIGRLVGIIIHNQEKGASGDIPLSAKEKFQKICSDIFNQTREGISNLLHIFWRDLTVDIGRKQEKIRKKIKHLINKILSSLK